ncbi:hypothetical protein AK812_SmicGene62 [Symbiodinium microadriaticum]|uniref:Uncharacterized protein n=1 Tax=Symbiodinium microadriaticum TaxID=2951 RepID=A0A1Q9F7K9_SYMMI|nr:hypothetical protein AK812_SmicGene62 [Symbiodinium microadriaticum]
MHGGMRRIRRAAAVAAAATAGGHVLFAVVGANLPAAPERFEETPEYAEFARRHMVDEEALFAASDFPIPPQDLIRLAKKFLVTEAPEKVFEGDGSMLADDFQFVGPVIGPLDKKAFYGQRDSVDFFRSFPDATAEFHHFRVDPFEPNRVWWTVRGAGTHTGDAMPGSDAELLFGPPTGKRFRNPPQSCSLTFNAQGQVRQFSIGYVMDRASGNTGGLGGFFGVLFAIGKRFPFEEGQPWTPSWSYRLYVQAGQLFGKLRILLAKEELEKQRLRDAMVVLPASNEDLLK